MARLFQIHVPAENSARFTIRTTLSGKEYEILFDYNGREDRWYATLRFEEEVISRSKVVSGIDLFTKATSINRPPGALSISKFNNDPIVWGDLGSKAFLFYSVEE